MESASNVPAVPPRQARRRERRAEKKALRLGQIRVLELLVEILDGAIPAPRPPGFSERTTFVLALMLTTGYGKTLTAMICYAKLRERRVCNRLVYVVTSQAQLDQIAKSGVQDLRDAGIDGVVPFVIDDPRAAITAWKSGRYEAFAVMVQMLAGPNGWLIRELIADPAYSTAVIVDESHHFGDEKKWGMAIQSLDAKCVIAMSATPYRRERDGIFGEPMVKVTYLQAVEEKAAKFLELHSYEYRVDAVHTETGAVHTFTTSELLAAVGSDKPDEIDRYIASKQLRWSSLYITPLVSKPIARMRRQRAETGLPLQMIIGTMSCEHARVVCEQVREILGTDSELTVDWVGTSSREGHGRKAEVNAAVLRRFCPPKVHGVRRPQDVKLDILVHVAMAGEGLDSTFVTEVVHLNQANMNNQNDQENGRAARAIPNLPWEFQRAYVNVDSSSPYAKWAGKRVMEAFDRVADEPPTGIEDEEDARCRHEAQLEFEFEDMPPTPRAILTGCELSRIDYGEEDIQRTALAFMGAALEHQGYRHTDIAESLRVMGERMRRGESDDVIEAWEEKAIKHLETQAYAPAGSQVDRDVHDALKREIASCVAVAARNAAGIQTGRAILDKNLVGEKRRLISTQMIQVFKGRIEDCDHHELQKRRPWICDLDAEMRRTGRLPAWLE